MDHPPPDIVDTVRSAIRALGDTPQILDVGGGGEMRIPGIRGHLTVVDNSPEALCRHMNAAETLSGDAQTFDYGQRRFDVVIFWNVLEHLADPEAALRRACATVREGGLVVVRGPTLDSTKALVTRLTPHRMHVLFYRLVSGISTAGQPGFAPFPIQYHRAATVTRLAALLSGLGFEQVLHRAYVGNQTTDLRAFSRPAYLAFEAAGAVLRAASGGRVGQREDEFVMLWRKAGAPGVA